ncbi:hypothetical protein, partial [Streptomyces violaceorubidus]|uniref:hypothetical protein n=1 Tax=Streptomyces violaceorubidus TaxID=284042 RepID=UPI0012FEDBAE
MDAGAGAAGVAGGGGQLVRNTGGHSASDAAFEIPGEDAAGGQPAAGTDPAALPTDGAHGAVSSGSPHAASASGRTAPAPAAVPAEGQHAHNETDSEQDGAGEAAPVTQPAAPSVTAPAATASASAAAAAGASTSAASQPGQTAPTSTGNATPASSGAASVSSPTTVKGDTTGQGTQPNSTSSRSAAPGQSADSPTAGTDPVPAIADTDAPATETDAAAAGEATPASHLVDLSGDGRPATAWADTRRGDHPVVPSAVTVPGPVGTVHPTADPAGRDSDAAATDGTTANVVTETSETPRTDPAVTGAVAAFGTPGPKDAKRSKGLREAERATAPASAPDGQSAETTFLAAEVTDRPGEDLADPVPIPTLSRPEDARADTADAFLPSSRPQSGTRGAGPSQTRVAMAHTQDTATDALNQRTPRERLDQLTPGSAEHSRLQAVLDTYEPVAGPRPAPQEPPAVPETADSSRSPESDITSALYTTRIAGDADGADPAPDSLLDELTRSGDPR